MSMSGQYTVLTTSMLELYHGKLWIMSQSRHRTLLATTNKLIQSMQPYLLCTITEETMFNSYDLADQHGHEAGLSFPISYSLSFPPV